MKVYGISGLGADKRVFDFLSLELEFIAIEWIDPLSGENIVEYAKRLSKVIDTSEKYCLLGVSFGGLVATEISKFLKPELTILISSAETKKELRLIYRVFGKIKWLKYIPEKLFDPPRWIVYYLFGTRKKELLNQILDSTDLKFAKWAVLQLIIWDSETQLKRVIKISGTKDKLIPPSESVQTILIPRGEHFMIVDRAKEISDIINLHLNKITTK